MVATITLSVDEFRAYFPEFADSEVYTDASLEAFIEQAYCYVSPYNIGHLRNGCRKLAIALMAAHLQTLSTAILKNNSQVGRMASASIDGVSISLTQPQNQNQFEFWINQTPYGQRYYALLQAKAPAGLYYGGSNQRVFRQ